MEFGLIPPMFGMGMVNSLSEVIRSQQQATGQALTQVNLRSRLEELWSHQPSEAVPPPVEECINARSHGGHSSQPI